MARGRPSKKAHIIEAASILFTKQGYQSTSIDQVVTAAAVSKPTVYSNFPTKLALWDNVLLSITERAQAEMYTSLAQLQSEGSATFVSGWLMLWKAWIKEQERLAVYRILLGERHKVADTTIALYDEFEQVLESALQSWLSGFEFEVPFFVLKSVTKEALLMPALLHQEDMVTDDLTQWIEWLIKSN